MNPGGRVGFTKKKAGRKAIGGDRGNQLYQSLQATIQRIGVEDLKVAAKEWAISLKIRFRSKVSQKRKRRKNRGGAPGRKGEEPARGERRVSPVREREILSISSPGKRRAGTR